MNWKKISIYPTISTAIDIEIRQNINEALVLKITSTIPIIINGSFVNNLAIQIESEYNQNFSVSAIYYNHSYHNEQWHYTYIAYNPEIFKTFLNQSQNLLGKNILNNQQGLISVHPNTHCVTIAPLLGSRIDHEINPHFIIEKQIEPIGNHSYIIECTIDTPYIECERVLNFVVAPEMYDYLANREEIVICDLNDENMEISVNIKCKTNNRYIFYAHKPNEISQSQEKKTLYFLLDQTLSDEEIILLGETIIKTAYIYHHITSVIILKLLYIPANLQVGMKIQYNNTVYFLWSFYINKAYCKLKLIEYNEIHINKKQVLILEKNETEDFYEFLRIEKDKLFIRKEYKESTTHSIQYIFR